MRVLVTGDPNFDDYEYLSAVLQMMQDTYRAKFRVIVNYGSGRADRLAWKWGRANGCVMEVYNFPPRDESMAQRNRRVVKSARSKLAIVFGGGNAAGSLVHWATIAGLDVRRFGSKS